MTENYLTIYDLPARDINTLSITDALLLTSLSSSYKVTLETLLTMLEGYTGDLNASTLEGAINELLLRVIELEKTTFKSGTAPTVADGATEGDTWYDTTNEVLMVYREIPSGSGTYVWTPLVYATNDIIDGGSY